MKMTPIGPMVSAEEARDRLLKAAVPVRRTESIPLGHAVGRVAARTVRAPRPVPDFLRATWDGYAFRAEDARGATRRAPARLTIVGELHAEETLGRRLRRGECVAIATGAALPTGADTVQLFEEVQVEDGALLLSAPVPRGNGLAEPGEDIRRGQVVLRPGEVLTPARLGAVGATGASSVEVYARPAVALVPNGNELVPPGEPLTAGRIHEFNNFTLSAVVAACGALPLALSPVPDDAPVLQGTLEGALRQADLVIATGGSSVGERDLLPVLFPLLGKMIFRGIRVRPGKPTLAARAGGKLLLGMPGHPTSCLSNAFWLLVPLLRKLASLPGDGFHREEAVLAGACSPPTPGFTSIVPVRLEGGRAYPTFHGSSAITSLTEANGYLWMGPNARPLPRGARAIFHRLPPPLG